MPGPIENRRDVSLTPISIPTSAKTQQLPTTSSRKSEMSAPPAATRGPQNNNNVNGNSAKTEGGGVETANLKKMFSRSEKRGTILHSFFFEAPSQGVKAATIHNLKDAFKASTPQENNSNQVGGANTQKPASPVNTPEKPQSKLANESQKPTSAVKTPEKPPSKLANDILNVSNQSKLDPEASSFQRAYQSFKELSLELPKIAQYKADINAAQKDLNNAKTPEAKTTAQMKLTTLESKLQSSLQNVDKATETIKEQKITLKQQQKMLEGSGEARAGERVKLFLNLFTENGSLTKDSSVIKEFNLSITSSEESEKLNKEIVDVAKGTPFRSISVDLESIRKERQELIPGYATRIAKAKHDIENAKTPEEKHTAETQLKLAQDSKNTAEERIANTEKNLLSSINQLKDDAKILKYAGKNEAAKKLDMLLDLVGEAGNLTVDDSKINHFLNQTMSQMDFNMKIVGRGETIRAQTWEEDNLLRAPLNHGGIETLKNHYNLLDSRLNNDTNKQALKTLESCLNRTEAAINEFHALPQGFPTMKEMIGKSKPGEKPFVVNQDLSSVSSENLSILKDKAIKLKADLSLVQKDLQSIKSQPEGEASHMGLFGIHGQLAAPLSKMTGMSKQLLGKPVSPDGPKGQLDELIDLIGHEMAKRSS